jgi:hypothetical protein
VNVLTAIIQRLDTKVIRLLAEIRWVIRVRLCGRVSRPRTAASGNPARSLPRVVRAAFGASSSLRRSPAEGRLTERTAAIQPRRREWVKVPHSRPLLNSTRRSARGG